MPFSGAGGGGQGWRWGTARSNEEAPAVGGPGGLVPALSVTCDFENSSCFSLSLPSILRALTANTYAPNNMLKSCYIFLRTFRPHLGGTVVPCRELWARQTCLNSSSGPGKGMSLVESQGPHLTQAGDSKTFAGRW